MSDVIDLNGGALDGAALESGKTYRNGRMRYVTAHKTEGVTLDGIRLLTGEKHGLHAIGAKALTLVNCAIDSEDVPKSGTHGVFFQSGTGLTVQGLKVKRARLGVTARFAADVEIVDGDFTGISEDAIRFISCTNAATRRCQFHDFAGENIGGEGLHPDSIQVFTYDGIPNAGIAIEDNLCFVGKGSKYQGPFIRAYDDQPAPTGLVVRRNVVLCQMGNGIVVAGDGELVDNFVAGYEGLDTSKISLNMATWRGKVSGNKAQHWLNSAVGYKKGWAPDGNEYVEAVTEEQAAQIVADWRARFRPEPIILPEGLSPAVLAFLDERYNPATGSRVTVRR